MKSYPYAYPPVGMTREQAASYLSLSPAKFDDLVRDGRMPKPVKVDGRNIWDRDEIEGCFRSLPRERDARIAEMERAIDNGTYQAQLRPRIPGPARKGAAVLPVQR